MVENRVFEYCDGDTVYPVTASNINDLIRRNILTRSSLVRPHGDFFGRWIAVKESELATYIVDGEVGGQKIKQPIANGLSPGSLDSIVPLRAEAWTKLAQSWATIQEGTRKFSNESSSPQRAAVPQVIEDHFFRNGIVGGALAAFVIWMYISGKLKFSLRA